MSGTEHLSAVKLALLATQVRERLGEGGVTGEPIAVLGVGCRLPGGIDTPEGLWDLVRAGGDVTGPVPADRWVTGPDGTVAGSGVTGIAAGGFVDGIDRFDAAYFGISPREAAHMDPQQRLVLEVAVEALERAGQPTDALAGSLTGVFLASTLHDYGDRYVGHLADIDAHTLTGNAHCIIPNRLSFLYDLRGPSVAVDTACSSSLVAIHLACQSLRSGDSDLALAGGVNVILTPDTGVALARWGLVASDGRCRTFDRRADGFVRGEGCGIVVLKRLSDAIADNDPVVAVIRGTAVNQDGRSTAMSAPNGRAQQDVVRRALRDGAVAPGRVGAVEAHGTGTIIGDPIEVEALDAVLGDRSEDAPSVALMAVKANLGHLEAAAGVAGLIKAVLCLQHGEVPPVAGFAELNPDISLEGSRLFVPTALRPWPRSEHPRIAGVSSFGFGGTNAHVVVEEAPVLPTRAAEARSHLLVLSARSAVALRESAARLADALDAGDPGALAAVCATASRRRTHHDERLAVVGATSSALAASLRAAAVGESRGELVVGRRRAGRRRRVAFAFSGQGTQWWGMARDLVAEDGPFLAALQRVDAAVRARAGWSVLDELAGDEGDSRLDRTEVAQPVLFALQVALAAQWEAWGVRPDAVVGHSVGEVAAAHVAGALTLEQAVDIVVERGRRMDRATGHGAMASVALAADELAAVVEQAAGAVSVAAVNAPRTTVLAGDTGPMEAAVAELRSRGVEVRPLGVDYAFHSRQMETPAAELGQALAGLAPGAGRVAIVSSVTGAPVAGEELGASYWARNVAEPVRFAAAVEALLDDGVDVVLELGPHPVLGGAVLDTASARGVEVAVAGSLRRGRAGLDALLLGLGRLHVAGVDVDWTAVHPGRPAVVGLPPYPWQRERHWYEVAVPATGAVPRPGSGGGLLGRPIRAAAIEGTVHELELTPHAPAFLDDHRLGDVVVVPGTGHLAMAAASFAATTGRPAARILDLEILEGLVVGPAEPTVVQVHVTGDAGSASFSVASLRAGDRWGVHARGSLSADPSGAPSAIEPEAWTAGLDAAPGASLYADVARRGVAFGPSFQLIEEVWTGPGVAVGSLLAPAGRVAQVPFDPALLDAAIHPVVTLLPGPDDLYLPVGVSELRLHGSLDRARWSRVVLRGEEGPTRTVDVTIADDLGTVVAELVGVRVVRTSTAAVTRLADAPGGSGPGSASSPVPLHGLRWELAGETAPTGRPGRWTVVADQGGVGASLAAHLADEGVGATLVAPEADLDGSVLDAALVDGDDAPLEVVYLRGLDTPAPAAGGDPVADQERALAGALAVARAVGRAGSTARLWFVSRGAQPVAGSTVSVEQATLVGLAAAVRAELDATCVSLDLDPAMGESAEVHAAALVAAVAGADAEDVVAWRDGRRWAPRLEELPPAAADAADARRLVVGTPGVLDGLEVVRHQRVAPAAGEVEIEVHVTGLNFRDVLVALDLYPERIEHLGEECCGVVTRVGAGVTALAPGQRVVAVGPGSFASHVTAAAELVAAVPDGLDDAAAASVPIAFLTAIHGLRDLAGLGAGERVLIHAAAGGVGLAAVQVAQRAGAEVFATAGSPAKRARLAELGVEHVFDSRSLEFVDGVRAATGGAGVDVVLNSLSGEFIPRSLELLAPGGRFVEIGRRDVWDAEQVAAVRPDVAHHLLLLADTRVADPGAIHATLVELIDLVGAGELSPLPTTEFPLEDAVGAFRYMAAARHTGKVVVRHRGVGGPLIRPDGSYLVTGGLGGLGLEVARHLADRGARSLVVLGRSAPGAAEQEALDELRTRGVAVLSLEADVADRTQLRAALDEVRRTSAPLRGVVHAAGVLADAVVDHQTWDRLATTLAPKVGGAALLDELTSADPLDFLVLFSAAGVVLGAPGQAGYAAANAHLDALAAARAARGLPTVAIGWGPWDDVGMAATIDTGAAARMARRGVLPMPPAAGLAAFDEALRHLRTAPPSVLAVRLDPSTLPDRPVLSSVRLHSASPGAALPTAAVSASWSALPEALRRAAVATFLLREATKVLGLAATTDIDPRQPFQELGLDSLMAVELRNAIGAALGRPQPATLLFDHPTLEALGARMVAELDPATDGGDPGERVLPPPPAVDLGDVAALTEEEAETLLLQELDQGGGRP